MSNGGSADVTRAVIAGLLRADEGVLLRLGLVTARRALYVPAARYVAAREVTAELHHRGWFSDPTGRVY